ncbi:MAG: DUF2304 domain-containing protein [Bacteroidota bacterium]
MSMDFRLFQWLIPAIAILFLVNQLLRYRRGRINLGEAIFVSGLWMVVSLLAIFPDLISGYIAELLGIKSNTNAILFIGMGCLFYFQYRLYHLQVQQRRIITMLTRKIALDGFEEEQEG